MADWKFEVFNVLPSPTAPKSAIDTVVVAQLAAKEADSPAHAAKAINTAVRPCRDSKPTRRIHGSGGFICKQVTRLLPVTKSPLMMMRGRGGMNHQATKNTKS